jgi:predicted XRE-type DNA-binding protein
MKSFELFANKKKWLFPYSKLNLKPTMNNPIAKVVVDSDFGDEGFTYYLKSGTEATVPMDAVLEYNKDPKYIREQLLYNLTLQARQIIKQKRISHNEIIRRMKISQMHFYRIINTTCYTKTIDQMVLLLAALDYCVDVKIRKIS